jgi:hypothetical protein
LIGHLLVRRHACCRLCRFCGTSAALFCRRSVWCSLRCCRICGGHFSCIRIGRYIAGYGFDAICRVGAGCGIAVFWRASATLLDFFARAGGWFRACRLAGIRQCLLIDDFINQGLLFKTAGIGDFEIAGNVLKLGEEQIVQVINVVWHRDMRNMGLLKKGAKMDCKC